jgi:hypothetical protein
MACKVTRTATNLSAFIGYKSCVGRCAYMGLQGGKLTILFVEFKNPSCIVVQQVCDTLV